MTQSFLVYAPKIVFDFLFDILYFLPWWYSRGLIKIIKNTGIFLKEKERELAIFLWLKNIFKPLYEQYGVWGMIKSFIKRIFQIAFRSLILVFWLSVSLIKIVLYLILPLLTIWQITYQLLIIN